MAQGGKILVTEQGSFDLSAFKWDDHLFSDLLIRENQIDGDRAMDISRSLQEEIHKMKLHTITIPLLEKIIEAKLLEYGLTKPQKRELKKIDEIILFESCCAFSHYPGIGKSSKYILDKIGLHYKTLEEQSCCGGFAYYANDLGLNELTLISARNQSLFENEADAVVSVCPTCFSSNLEVKKLLSEKENRNQVNDILSVINKRISVDINMVQIEDVIHDNLDLIANSIELDLSKVKIATHTACHNKYFNSGVKNNNILDELVRNTGAKLINYSLKDSCCGGGFEKSFIGDIDKVRQINSKKQSSIADMEADLVILDCPGCEMTFDRNNPALSKTQPLNLGYMHIVEFLAMAMGADPDQVVGVQYHTAYTPLLEKLKIENKTP